MAYALYKILNGKDNELSSAVTSTVAKDMTNSASAYKYSVGWCMDNGIIAGIGGGKFGPTNIVTREQMATLLYRTAQYQDLDTNNYSLYALYSLANSRASPTFNPNCTSTSDYNPHKYRPRSTHSSQTM